jgi:hypothetical protein
MMIYQIYSFLQKSKRNMLIWKTIKFLEVIGLFTRFGSILYPVLMMVFLTVPPAYHYSTYQTTSEILAAAGNLHMNKLYFMFFYAS